MGLPRWQRLLAAEAGRPTQPPVIDGAQRSAPKVMTTEPTHTDADGRSAPLVCEPKDGQDVAAALTSGLEEYSRALAEGASTAALQALGLKILYTTLGARRAVLCAREADGWLRACSGIGEGVESLQQAFAVAPLDAEAKRPDDLFALLLDAQRDSWIAQPNGTRIRERLPLWYRPFLDSAMSFVVMPLRRAQEVVGLIYLDGPDVRADALGEEEQRLLRTLKQLLTGPSWRGVDGSRAVAESANTAVRAGSCRAAHVSMRRKDRCCTGSSRRPRVTS
ncbi:hypothetical protein Tchar_01783 [Tepidimonas charontis]|uniref:GAF domain-containing protein n=2 Tax=Tepidimonas charontis TaxID=2267262 RepID=A0A554XBP4_9BURK|nr:hypothetical protein Tchar_01783 [Tepidimonas charontis]